MGRTIELLRLIRVCERIDSRRKIQKVVYILREAGHPFAYRYEYHFHGPFSIELKGEIDALIKQELIVEEPGDSDFGDSAGYTYRLGDSALNLLASRGAPESWAPLAMELNAKPAQDLEAISTVIYLIRNGCTEESLRDRFGALKPNLADQYDETSRFACGITAVNF